jgi:hypothetical protein
VHERLSDTAYGFACSGALALAAAATAAVVDDAGGQAFFTVFLGCMAVWGCYEALRCVRKLPVFVPFHPNDRSRFHLPRQARDKRKDSSPKRIGLFHRRTLNPQGAVVVGGSGSLEEPLGLSAEGEAAAVPPAAVHIPLSDRLYMWIANL